jgi:hypothetical protein
MCGAEVLQRPVWRLAENSKMKGLNPASQQRRKRLLVDEAKFLDLV